MKILSAIQTKELDKHTIQEQKITSTDLMERAANAFVKWFRNEYDNDKKVEIIAGIGDNGGDGLAVGRLLVEQGYTVKIYIIRFSEKTTKDFDINLQRLKRKRIEVIEVNKGRDCPSLAKEAILIDAILGAGLNRPLKGWLADLVQEVNQQQKEIVAIDIPSGVFADKVTDTISIAATKTMSFELPKLAFFFPQNFKRIGEWSIDTIHSSTTKIQNLSTNFYYVDGDFIKNIYRPKSKFDHKGTNGHALLIAGSYGMMGAALLAGKAALRSGAGLVTLHSPKCGYQIIQTTIPEAIVRLDDNDKVFSNSRNFQTYSAVGIGCGLGQQELTAKGLLELLKTCSKPLVLDADALNLIAMNNWQSLIPKESIITPHIKEFQRLFGKTNDDFERNELQRKQAKHLGITIVLKGAHTAICTANGNCYFNSTGNPGMATGGSGDVLTGIITALLAQGYTGKNAAILGGYLHGLAGDLAVEKMGYESLIASDITNNLGQAFLKINPAKT